MSSTPRSAAESGRNLDRAIEVLAVILLGIATLGSAWSAYQSTRWNGEEADFMQEATTQRVEAARLYGLATQKLSYDTNLLAQYAEAYVAGNDRLVEFYRTSLMRPELIEILDRWEAEIAATGKAPPGLLEDPEYLDAQLASYRTAESLGDAAAALSDEASRRGDQYVLLTVIFASALFCAGVTSSFRTRFGPIVMLAGSAVLIAYAASRLADYQVA